MAKKEKKRRRSSAQRVIAVPTNCPFDKDKTNPSYKDYHGLEKYLSDRSKILAKKRTGLCTKHQRKLTIAVKRARHLALLPFS